MLKILTKLLPAIFSLLLAACASSSSNIAISKPGAKLDRAKFDAYTFRTLYSGASHVICDYGKERIAYFGSKVPPDHKVWGGSTHSTWAVYPEMKCTWLAADGSFQQEIVKTGEGLFAKYLEWEHFDNEELVEDEPIRFKSVIFTIQVKDKQFSILRDFNVQLHGEKLSENEYRVKAVKVEQVIYQRQ